MPLQFWDDRHVPSWAIYGGLGITHIALCMLGKESADWGTTLAHQSIIQHDYLSVCLYVCHVCIATCLCVFTCMGLHLPTHPLFMWLFGIRSQGLMFIHQTLYWLSYFSSTNILMSNIMGYFSLFALYIK